MTALIEKVIQQVKSMISKMEQEGKAIVQAVGEYSYKAAQEIQVLLASIFRTIKTRMSRLIQSFKAKINSLRSRRSTTSVGSEAKSFGNRLRSAMKTAERDIEKLAQEFKEGASAFFSESKEVMGKIGSGLKTAAVDSVSVTRRVGGEVFSALEKIGKEAIEKTEKFVEDFGKDLEISGEFAYKHGIAVGGATLAVMDPILPLGLAASALIVIGSHKYAENMTL